MKRLKGPALKMPDLKVPAVASDLYYDLRDRRLLPLVALVIVAIVAVPFLLGGSEEPTLPVAQSPDAGESTLEATEAAHLTVVAAKPGLRDYRKRLAGREPTDPFKQRFTGGGAAGAQLNPQTESSATGGGTTTTSVSTTGSSEPSGGGAAPPSGGASPAEPPSMPSDGQGDGRPDGKPDLTFYTFAVNVRIVKSGSANAEAGQKQEPVVKERVLPLTALPGEKAPVVTYMGSSKKGKALLLVSNEVRSVFGETRCVSGESVCQLLEAEPGFPVTFVYGAGETRYSINVLKIYPVVTGRSNG
jgi:hypothetical protein